MTSRRLSRGTPSTSSTSRHTGGSRAPKGPRPEAQHMPATAQLRSGSTTMGGARAGDAAGMVQQALAAVGGGPPAEAVAHGTGEARVGGGRDHVAAGDGGEAGLRQRAAGLLVREGAHPLGEVGHGGHDAPGAADAGVVPRRGSRRRRAGRRPTRAAAPGAWRRRCAARSPAPRRWRRRCRACPAAPRCAPAGSRRARAPSAARWRARRPSTCGWSTPTPRAAGSGGRPWAGGAGCVRCRAATATPGRPGGPACPCGAPGSRPP